MSEHGSPSHGGSPTPPASPASIPDPLPGDTDVASSSPAPAPATADSPVAPQQPPPAQPTAATAPAADQPEPRGKTKGTKAKPKAAIGEVAGGPLTFWVESADTPVRLSDIEVDLDKSLGQIRTLDPNRVLQLYTELQHNPPAGLVQVKLWRKAPKGVCQFPPPSSHCTRAQSQNPPSVCTPAQSPSRYCVCTPAQSPSR